ncbi:MAG: helix-hairpin-helix domain-containing protein [Clostridia bacterium]|jgi:competence protein ComEA|nr:helix-hairpin-helix domain-containing protein [Clostridia bacterium]
MGIVITSIFYVNMDNEVITETKIEKQKEEININDATYDELITLKGIGPSTAKKILDYRSKNGNFKTVEELMNVKGIGEKKCNSLKEIVVCK